MSLLTVSRTWNVSESLIYKEWRIILCKNAQCNSIVYLIRCRDLVIYNDKFYCRKIPSSILIIQSANTSLTGKGLYKRTLVNTFWSKPMNLCHSWQLTSFSNSLLRRTLRIKILMDVLTIQQRRQSGLKSGGSWTRVKKIRFSIGKFPKNLFFQAISQTKNRFFRANFRKFRVFSGNFTKNFDF